MPSRGLCVIVGAGAQGRVVLDVWRAARPDAELVFLDDDPATHGSRVLGAPVKGPVSLAGDLGGEVVLALGNNPLRLELAERLSKDGRVRWGNAIHPSAAVMPTATIGPGAVVFAAAAVNTEAKVGAHVIVNTGAIVEHDCVLEDGASIGPGACMGGRVHVGRGAFISTGVTLAPRVRVGASSVVGAGAVVVKDLPERVLALGVPARVVKELDASFDWRRLL